MEILSGFRDLTRAHREWARAVVFFCLGVVASCLLAEAAGDQAEEYQVKAAFLYNFAKFVQWPAGAFQNASEPIAICVLGQNPFGRSLEETVAGRMIDGRPLTVRNISNVKQAAGCHVLFITSAEHKKLALVLEDLKSSGILTIGEADASGAAGPIINFRLESGKVRFEINLEAAEQGKLRISSRLLSLAHIVDTRK